MNIEEINNMSAEEAIKVLDRHLEENPYDDEALTLRGMRHWSLSHRSQASNDYLAAIRLNPASPAVQLLQSANDILNFYNKDLYNP